MTDYERGVNQASAIYQEAIRDYVTENARLRNLVVKAHTCERCCADCYQDEGCCPIEREMQELGIEVDA